MDLKDALDVLRAPRSKKILAEMGFKVFLKYDRKIGWSGELPFYLFWCSDCHRFVCDYPHGFPENQYLNCPECRRRFGFVRVSVGLKKFFLRL